MKNWNKCNNYDLKNFTARINIDNSSKTPLNEYENLSL